MTVRSWAGGLLGFSSPVSPLPQLLGCPRPAGGVVANLALEAAEEEHVRDLLGQVGGGGDEVQLGVRLPFSRQGDTLQTRPVLGVAARSSDRKRSSFLDEVCCNILLTGVQGLHCAPEVLSPCARDGFAGGRPEET